MSIEVKQMIVKSNVLQRRELGEEDRVQNSEETKKAILDECRRLILEALREIRER